MAVGFKWKKMYGLIKTKRQPGNRTTFINFHIWHFKGILSTKIVIFFIPKIIVVNDLFKLSLNSYAAKVIGIIVQDDKNSI